MFCLCTCKFLWMFVAVTRAVRRRHCSRGRRQPARLLRQVRKPSAARQRTTRRRTGTTKAPFPNALRRSNCWQSLGRAIARGRYENRKNLLTNVWRKIDMFEDFEAANIRYMQWETLQGEIEAQKTNRTIYFYMTRGNKAVYQMRCSNESRMCNLTTGAQGNVNAVQDVVMPPNCASKAFSIAIWICHPDCIFFSTSLENSRRN